MKKLMNYIKKFLILLTTIFSFFSCSEIGLGAAVDLKAPEVEITSHQDNDTVPSEFLLQGYAYDNEEVKSITVDFDTQNLHYKVIPGESWYKKTTETADQWVIMTTSEADCKKNGKNWEWSVYVKTNEGTSSNSTYNLSILVTDEQGNSSNKSKVELSLIRDSKNPDVIVYKPELLSGLYDSILQEVKSFSLCNGNVISNLLNGDITLTGRQSGSISFKELRIEFDNGSLDTGTRLVTGDGTAQNSVDSLAESLSFENDERTKVYFSKTLKRGEDNISDLRNWELTVKQNEWVNKSKNSDLLSLGETLGSGKLIRVVTTSLSDSNAWEKKVAGYFVWWPEADKPWINTYTGDSEYKGESTYEVYPASNFSGTVQDDDGIKELYYVLEKLTENSTWEQYSKANIGLSEENATYSAFSIKTPSENGIYKITITVKDIYGSESSSTKYFKTLDVAPPKINLESPVNGTSVLSDANGNIKFTGTVTDDGAVSSFELIYLNPIANDDSTNIIRYMSGNETDWAKATTAGADSDEYSYTKDGSQVKYKNKIYKIALSNASYNSEKKINEYTFNKTLNLFNDLGINAETKPLVTQYFVLRAVDNGNTKTVSQISLTGDTETPTLEINKIQQFASNGTSKIAEFTFTGSEVPTFAVVKDGDYAILSGTWSDNSVKAWNNDKSKIGGIKFDWGSAEAVITEETRNSQGVWSWKAKLTNLPKSTQALTAELTDAAGNTKTVRKSIFIETAELGIVSIDALTDDGSYSTGKTIQITLNFTKNTSVTYTNAPQLKLNNGAYATYVSGGEVGGATSQHIFEYTIKAGDNDTNGNLDVVSLITNGAQYKDASVSGGAALTEDDLGLPTENSKKLGTARNIIVDKTAPLISGLELISANGYYNAGKTVLFRLSFNETVTLPDDVSGLGLSFTGIASPSVTAQSSGSSIVFTYTVGAGENASPLKVTGLTGTSGITIKDLAGNALSNWAHTSTFSGIYIDTTTPAAPTINASWGSNKLVTAATSFTVTGEAGATVEYSIDDGSNWQTYSSTVNLSNNGTYFVKARQTDRAGNVSAIKDGGNITVEKGDFFTKITADTTSGTYSVNKGGSIKGRLVFRKDITIPTGATVTLNAKNSAGTYYKPVLTKSGSSTINGGCDYTFTYTIAEGDYIQDDAALEVTGWSFDSVTYSVAGVGDISYGMSYASNVTGAKKLSANRQIKIKTGHPGVQGTPTLNGTTLTINFDRPISKSTGNITLSLDGDAYSDNFIAPAVISAGEFSSVFGAYYTEGLNGATGAVETTLTNDTTTKYVLNYETAPTDASLVGLFKTAGWNKVEIPVVSSAVTVSGTTLTVDLSSTYKLPVKGAKYKLTLPQGLVSDSVQNKNTASVASVTAGGVEAPVIRINKGSQTVTPGASPNFTVNSSVTMPATATMRIDCQTPNATITYETRQTKPEQIQVIDSQKLYNTKSDAPTAPNPTTAYTDAITLGGGDNAVTNYATATGLKIAISAKASKNGVNSATVFEYATRTVLKLNISGNYRDGANGTNGGVNTVTEITEDGAALKFGQLKVWIIGGDSPYGGNSISPFPLSWHDSSNFKLMKAENDPAFDENMYCKWYWVSWDITAATYHGFVLGDVPSDAATNGPTQWYSGEAAWDAQKANYILYPGEHLEMNISGTGTYDNGNFRWRTKNHGTR